MTAARTRRAGGRRIGLSLAGGGHAGAIYEIGATWALQEALEGIDLTALTCYVGVSAGALVSACLANGMRPDLLVRVVHGDAEEEEPLTADIFLASNFRGFRELLMATPRVVARSLWSLVGARQRGPLGAGLAAATSALPLGLFDNEPIRRYLARVFARHGRTDDFRELGTRLVIVAADLESARPVRLGLPEHPEVPISRAVQASTALPGVYPPVKVDGHLCVDGVLLKTLHASAALEEGVGLLLCVNPLVPIDATALEARGVLPPGALLAHGLPAVLSQTFRTLVHSRLEVGMAGYAERYPDTDIVLFEPARDAWEMFFSDLLSLEARDEVCELAYQTTRQQLRERAEELEPLLARHGIRMRWSVLDDEARTVRTGYAAAVAPPRPLPRRTAKRASRP